MRSARKKRTLPPRKEVPACDPPSFFSIFFETSANISVRTRWRRSGHCRLQGQQVLSRQIVTTRREERMKIRLLSIYECTLSRSVVDGFQSLPLDSYTSNKAGNCNLIWIFMDEDGGDVSRLTRSGNCGLRPLECSVALQMKRNLDFRGFEPQRPSSPFVPPQSVGCCGVSGILATQGDYTYG
jgi:hypothetical protein